MIKTEQNNIAVENDEKFIPELLASLAKTQVKRRVLSIISSLQKEYWLDAVIKKYQKAINIKTFWFDALTFLNWYAKHFKPSNYLEIGVRRGRSMAQVLVESPETKAYGFDMWIPDYGSIPEKGIHVTNPGPDFVIEELKNLNINNIPILIKGDSHKTLPLFFEDFNNPKQFDLMFIDGDHSYEGAKLDMDIAFDHVAPGGVIVFDDISYSIHSKLRDLWNEYKAKYPGYLFIEDNHGIGTGVILTPPFTKLEKYFQTTRQTEATGDWNTNITTGIQSSNDNMGLPSVTENSISHNIVPGNYSFDSEMLEQQMVRRTVKAGMTVFDVGAHIGNYTKLFSLLAGDKGKVYAFEPSTRSFGKLVSTIRQFNCTNVMPIKKAVYSKNHNVILNEFPEEYSSWNSLGLPNMHNPRNPEISIPIENSAEVEAVTLDSFCNQYLISKIDYFKLDVEGAELQALIGASGLLENKAINHLQFEISKKMLDGLNTKAKFIFDFLKSKGYECHTINEDGTVGSIAFDSDSSYENYIAFPSKNSIAGVDPKSQIADKEIDHERRRTMTSLVDNVNHMPHSTRSDHNIRIDHITSPTTTPNSTHSKERPMHGNFTDGDLWTPETYMRQAIMDWLSQTSFQPHIALSVDKNPPLDAILIRRWPDIKIHRATYPQFDAQDLSKIADNQYDLVYSNQILEHIPKPWVAAAEMVRVLRPGGLGVHTTCAYNPRHGLPQFNDYYRFLPDGLAELFEGVKVIVKAGWGNRQALLYNLAVDDGHAALGGRRFCEQLGQKNDEQHPWHVWIIFEKLAEKVNRTPVGG